MAQCKYNSNGYMILEEDTDEMLACVLRMKAGTSKFRKECGIKDTTPVNMNKVYSAVEDVLPVNIVGSNSYDSDGCFDGLGGLAFKAIKHAAPVVVPKIFGLPGKSIISGVKDFISDIF